MKTWGWHGTVAARVTGFAWSLCLPSFFLSLSLISLCLSPLSFFLSFFCVQVGTSWLVLMLDKTNNAKAIGGLQLRCVREAGGASAPWEGSLKFGDSKIQIFVGNVVGVFCAHVCIFQGSFDHMKREGML